MDENTRQVLIAVVAAIGGLLSGGLIALLSYQHARSQQLEAWEREDRLRREQFEREHNARWLDQIREQYTSAFRGAQRIRTLADVRREGSTVTEAQYVSIAEEAFEACAEIRMLGPDLFDKATALVEAANKTYVAAAGPPEPFANAHGVYVQALTTFGTAAAANIESLSKRASSMPVTSTAEG